MCLSTHYRGALQKCVVRGSGIRSVASFDNIATSPFPLLFFLQ